MPKSVLLSLLKQGQTGDEILQILDALTAGDAVSESPQMTPNPTLESIEF